MFTEINGWKWLNVKGMRINCDYVVGYQPAEITGHCGVAFCLHGLEQPVVVPCASKSEEESLLKDIDAAIGFVK